MILPSMPMMMDNPPKTVIEHPRKEIKHSVMNIIGVNETTSKNLCDSKEKLDYVENKNRSQKKIPPGISKRSLEDRVVHMLALKSLNFLGLSQRIPKVGAGSMALTMLGFDAKEVSAASSCRSLSRRRSGST